MYHSSNLFNWDFRSRAQDLPQHSFGLIDAHCHINGARAALLYKEAAQLYGFVKAFSMSQLEEADAVKAAPGDLIEFIAFPRIRGEDPIFDHGKGYQERIQPFFDRGARIAKLWCAPRIFDFCPGEFASHPLRLDSAVRRPTIDKAVELDMKLMVHIADPDVWFKKTYTDERKYGSKSQHYEILDWLLENYKVPTIAAHLGGSPESLGFLDTLLTRHQHLYLDTSAMKWVVRELSNHSVETVKQFFMRWPDRIIFGTDVVTMDAHLDSGGEHEMAQKAANQAQAFDLYASRFWALRTLFETDLQVASPVEDPDYFPKSQDSKQVILRGLSLDTQVQALMRSNIEAFLDLRLV